MTVGLALVVRDEIDVVEHNLRFHLAHGVDLVVVVDHRSIDGTSDVLSQLAREHPVHVTQDDAPYIRQAAWMTRLVQTAGRLGADWVLCGDADEFWVADGGSVGAVLEQLPASVGAASVLQRTLLPVEGAGPFHERMTVRLATPAAIVDPGTPFKPVSKVAVRPKPNLRVSKGNHSADGFAGRELRGWHGLEILHAPIRTREQCADKYARAIEGWEVNPRADLARAGRLHAAGRSQDIWQRVALTPAIADAGVRAGVLALDTRLRDGLRQVSPAVRDRAALAAVASDNAVLVETELTRIAKRLDDLGAAVVAIERRFGRTGAVRTA